MVPVERLALGGPGRPGGGRVRRGGGPHLGVQLGHAAAPVGQVEALRRARVRGLVGHARHPRSGRPMRECDGIEGGGGGGSRGDRRLRRLGVLHAARGRPRGQGRHAVRPAVGQRVPGHHRGPAGRVPPAPRPSPHHPAAPDQLPGQRLGDALAGREGGHQPLRRGFAPAGRRARALRRQRPVRRPHDRPRGHVLRRPDRVPRLVGRDLRPDPARDRARRHPRARHHRPRRRHRRRDPGAPLLDQGRVEVVQRRRLAGHQHDPVPRGLPVPRARDGRRQHRPDHRLRRRASSRAPRP